MSVFQTEFALASKTRGFHIITADIERRVSLAPPMRSGFANLFLMHTGAGLTINENADPTTRMDFETFFSRLVPEHPALYRHSFEGEDDMPAHIKSSLLGCSVAFPIVNGKIRLGRWQGIYLCEFRNVAPARSLTLTIVGE